jgi:hypothetical protein
MKTDKDLNKMKKEELKEDINELEYNITNMLKKLDEPIENLLPKSDMLPNVSVQIEHYDYTGELEKLKIDSKETLKCLANLYLDENKMLDKNISNIIKNDAKQLADLDFSIFCSKRALVHAMKQIDAGSKDSELFKTIPMFQKELRDTIKMANELLHDRLKTFYRDLKNELEEINTGAKDNELDSNQNLTIVGDPKMLNDLLEQYKNDPTLLSKLIKK